MAWLHHSVYFLFATILPLLMLVTLKDSRAKANSFDGCLFSISNSNFFSLLGYSPLSPRMAAFAGLSAGAGVGAVRIEPGSVYLGRAGTEGKQSVYYESNGHYGCGKP